MLEYAVYYLDDYFRQLNLLYPLDLFWFRDAGHVAMACYSLHYLGIPHESWYDRNQTPRQ